MTEDEALGQASQILRNEGTVESGLALIALEPYIASNKFGNLWEAFVAASAFEVVVALNDE